MTTEKVAFTEVSLAVQGSFLSHLRFLIGNDGEICFNILSIKLLWECEEVQRVFEEFFAHMTAGEIISLEKEMGWDDVIIGRWVGEKKGKEKCPISFRGWILAVQKSLNFEGDVLDPSYSLKFFRFGTLVVKMKEATERRKNRRS